MSEELAIQPARLVRAKTEEESISLFRMPDLEAESDALDVRSQAGFNKAAVHLKTVKDTRRSFKAWFKDDTSGEYYCARQTLDQLGILYNRIDGKLAKMEERADWMMKLWLKAQEARERERIAAEAEAQRQASIREVQEKLDEAKRIAVGLLDKSTTKAQMEAAERAKKSAIRAAEEAEKQAEAKAAYIKKEAEHSARAITAATVKAPGTSISSGYDVVIENPEALFQHVLDGKLPMAAIFDAKVKEAMQSCMRPLAKSFAGRNAPPGVRFEPKATFVSRG